MTISRDHILQWLRETDAGRLQELWAEADRVRAEHVGDEVHLRGLIEFSNFCWRRCLYCGLRRDNTALARYRLCERQIMRCVREAEVFGYGTVVLQSGEDREVELDWLCRVVARIRNESSVAVTLSVGERSEDELLALRQAGADRYLLRFETSNRELFDRIHPPLDGLKCDRIALLRTLRKLGYEVGSGVMIGTPGQTYDDLANDIELFGELDLDMIGVGPYIAHEATPLGRHPEKFTAPPGEQVPADELMTYKTVALTRLMRPDTNIPATTALATLNTGDGRELALQRGANVIMPNITPVPYRSAYEIYPGKACITETAGQCHLCVQGRIMAIGRTVGRGRGDSPNILKRRAEAPVA